MNEGTIGNVNAFLRARTAGFVTGMRKAGAAVKTTTGKMQKAGPKIRQFASNLGNAAKMLGGFVAIAGTVVGITLAAKFFQINRETEKLHASLTTVTGSAEMATIAFQGIQKFAQETPFQVGEIAKSFIKMKALGLAPTENAMRSFGNTASAMGFSLNQMVEAVADASTMEFERLKEFGIKARQQANTVQFTFQNVTTTVAKNAGAITRYLTDIGNVQFAGAMARQMDMLDGILSNTTDNLRVSPG